MRIFLLAAAAAFSTAASAHGGDAGHTHDALLAGLLHPLTGADHLAAMLAVGMWSAQAVRPAWLAPAAFVALLAAGALAGFAGLPVPAVEPMIAASLLVLGLLVAVRKQSLHTLRISAVALVSAFAFFHGAAHGSELAGGQQWQALAGMLLASAGLHVAGMAIGRLVLERHRWLPRVSGAVVALLGVTLLARLA